MGHKMVLQIGRTKVFLRAGQMAELDARRAEVLSSAAKTIQRRIRTHIARRQFIALRKATIIVQSIWRGGQSDIYDCINQFYNYMQCRSWRLMPFLNGMISLWFALPCMAKLFRASVDRSINFCLPFIF
jgi:hypothetical protein